MKHKVTFKEKNERNLLVEKVKIFPNLSAACTFVRFIRSKTGEKPFLEEVK